MLLTSLKENLTWKNTKIGLVFLLTSSIGFILAFMVIFAGSSNFLYLLRIPGIPVPVIQIVLIVLSLAFALSFSLLVVDWLVDKTNPFHTTDMTYKHHIFFAMLLVITILDSSLFFVNIIAIICATLLFWLSKTRLWRILGFVAITLCIVMQLVTFLVYWR